MAEPERQGNIATTDARQHKSTSILDACRNENVDSLIAYATAEHGLVNDEVRRKACTSYGPRSRRLVGLIDALSRANSTWIHKRE